MKTCKRCGKTKKHEKFPRPGFRKDGVTYKGDGRRCVCKACVEKTRLARIAGWSDKKKMAYREASRKRTRAWHKQKPHHDKARHANLAAKRKGVDGILSPEDVQSAWEKWDGKCWVCGYDAEQLDHFRPTNKRAGGTNTADNIRPICRECNHKRSHDWRGEDIAMKEATMLRRIKKLLHGSARTLDPVVVHSERKGEYVKTGAQLIAEERRRQINEEGWTEIHDDQHHEDELVLAGASYAFDVAHPIDWTHPNNPEVPKWWPWDERWWKPTPKDRVRQLIKAGALIAAAIDRENRQRRK